MNIKNAGKKLAALSAVTFAMTIATTPAQAAFTHITSQAFPAGATITAAGAVTMNPQLLLVSNNTASTKIGWTIASLPASFTLGDSYILLNSTVTVGNGSGIQIYTDNTNTSAVPKYTGSTSTATAAGLVGSDGQSVLPLAWAIQPTPTTLTPATPNGTTGPTTDPAFVWRYLKDHSDQNIPNLNVTAWANGFFYVMAKESSGIQANTSSFTGGTTQVGYIYMEADFTSAIGNSTYGTSTITLEAFTQ